MSRRGKDNSIKGKTAVGNKERTYFLGEIFWTERSPWMNTPFGQNEMKPYRAGMVVVKSCNPDPVLMIPGTSRCLDDNGVFIPKTIAHNSSGTDIIGTYHFLYSRKVDRSFIVNDHQIGTISGQDKMELIKILNKNKINKSE